MASNAKNSKNKEPKDSHRLDKDTKSKIVFIEKRKFHVWELNPSNIKNPHNTIKLERTEGRRRNKEFEEEEEGNNLWVNYEEKYEDEIDCKVKIEKEAEPEAESNEQSKEAKEFTHFISLPITEKQFLDKIGSVLGEIEKICPESREFFCPLNSLHFTILMLRLSTEEKIKKAQEVMEGLKPAIEEKLKNISCTGVKIKNLGYFEESYIKSDKKLARVVFLEPESSDNGLDLVKGLATLIIKTFFEKEILTNEDLRTLHVNYDVKKKTYELENWHISLMRTRNKGAIPIEEIMKKYENFSFGKINLNKIELSIRKSHDSEGRYKNLKSFTV